MPDGRVRDRLRRGGADADRHRPRPGGVRRRGLLEADGPEQRHRRAGGVGAPQRHLGPRPRREPALRVRSLDTHRHRPGVADRHAPDIDGGVVAAALRPDLAVDGDRDGVFAARVQPGARDIRVVYPPVDTDSYAPTDAETGDYYVTLSRLDWHKDVDGIVRAFDGLDERLVVAGDGPERDALEAMAGENVTFEGFVSEARKRELLAGAKGFVFNGRDEDFGIAPVEALAAGTPLLGVDEGMTQYQVVPGKNGYTHDRAAGPAGIRKSVATFETEGVEWSPGEIASFADRFSVSSFHDGIRSAVADAAESSRTEPEWYGQYHE